MTDRIEIKDLDLLETVADDDEIAVQRKADGVLYKIERSNLRGEKGANWQGAWSAGTYQIGDIVENNSSSWIATAVTTQEPSAVASEWDLLAERGKEKTDTTDDTLTPDAGARVNRYFVTALDEDATLAEPTGTAQRGDTLAVQITATGATRTITYNAIYVDGIVETEDTIADGETLFQVYIYDGSEWVLSGQFIKD